MTIDRWSMKVGQLLAFAQVNLDTFVHGDDTQSAPNVEYLDDALDQLNEARKLISDREDKEAEAANTAEGPGVTVGATMMVEKPYKTADEVIDEMNFEKYREVQSPLVQLTSTPFSQTPTNVGTTPQEVMADLGNGLQVHTEAQPWSKMGSSKFRKGTVRNIPDYAVRNEIGTQIVCYDDSEWWRATVLTNDNMDIDWLSCGQPTLRLPVEVKS